MNLDQGFVAGQVNQAQPCEEVLSDMQPNAITPSELSTGSNSNQHSGKVVKWLPEKGYGFINHQNTKIDYFFHATDIQPSTRESLNIDENVTFEFGPTNNGGKQRAINVRGDGSGTPAAMKGYYGGRDSYMKNRKRRSHRGPRKRNKSDNVHEDDWRSNPRNKNDRYNGNKNISSLSSSSSVQNGKDCGNSLEKNAEQNQFNRDEQYAQNQLMYAVLTREQMGLWQAFATFNPSVQQQLLSTLPPGAQATPLMFNNPPPGFGPLSTNPTPMSGIPSMTPNISINSDTNAGPMMPNHGPLMMANNSAPIMTNNVAPIMTNSISMSRSRNSMVSNEEIQTNVNDNLSQNFQSLNINANNNNNTEGNPMRLSVNSDPYTPNPFYYPNTNPYYDPR
jgi:cold shock CspA family protein